MGFLCVHLQIDVYMIDRINSSDVLCGQLSVQSVYFDFNTLSRQNYFSRGYGGCSKYSWKFRRGGGVILGAKKWKFRGGGGVLHEIPSVVGVWIFSGTTHSDSLWSVEFLSFSAIIVEVAITARVLFFERAVASTSTLS